MKILNFLLNSNLQWFSGRKFSDIFKVLSLEDLQQMYSPLHEADISKFADIVDAKCASTSLKLTSSASAHSMAARRRSLPNGAMSAFGRSKCTSSATRTSTRPARKLLSASRKSSAAQWRIFWKSEPVAEGVYFISSETLNCVLFHSKNRKNAPARMSRRVPTFLICVPSNHRLY